MKCVVCGSKFYDQTYDSPADPCDCGQCITAEAAEHMTSHEMAAAKIEWKRIQDEEAGVDEELVAWAKLALRGLPESSVFAAVYNAREGNVRPEFLLHLGYSIMHDKLIVVPVPHGVIVPKKLEAVADAIVRYDPQDPKTLHDAVAVAMAKLDDKGRRH